MDFDWSKKACSDIEFWEKTNPKVARRIQALLESIMKEPYSGIGKPEPLKYELSGWWSRRITREHRLVYVYDKETNSLKIQSCKDHY